MTIAQLILTCPEQVLSISGIDPETKVSGLHYDSRKIGPGNLFFAISGYQSDGNQFVGQALSQGAMAVVSENNRPDSSLAWIRVANCRRALALMSAAFLGRPADKLEMMAVTGTAGKTTTTYLLRSIMEAAGRRTGMLGTISYWVGDREYPAPNTTPESLDLQLLLSQMVEAGADTAIMEASSHGIELDRVAGINFAVAVFTNLSQDHLDFHGDMESYLRSKLKLFQSLWSGSVAVVNADDPVAQRVRQAAAAGCLNYGIDHPAEVSARDIRPAARSTGFTLATPSGRVQISLAIPGRHNIYNALAAASAALARGVSIEHIRAGLEAVERVAGRFEMIDQGQDFSVMVDYAHTPEELSRLLAAVRELGPSRIITVFGCGGDRDRAKRPLMGRAVADNSDLVVVTSDNPRTEDPVHIIEDILPGLSGRECLLLPDRREAIRRAVELAQPDDMVVIAGKGHEDYQILGTRKVHFDDREEAREALKLRLGR